MYKSSVTLSNDLWIFFSFLLMFSDIRSVYLIPGMELHWVSFSSFTNLRSSFFLFFYFGLDRTQDVCNCQNSTDNFCRGSDEGTFSFQKCLITSIIETANQNQFGIQLGDFDNLKHRMQSVIQVLILHMLKKLIF